MEWYWHILEQKSYIRNKDFSVIKLHIMLTEHVSHTFLLTTSLLILGGVYLWQEEAMQISWQKDRDQRSIWAQVLLYRSYDALQVKQTCFLFCKYLSRPTIHLNIIQHSHYKPRFSVLHKVSERSNVHRSLL